MTVRANRAEAERELAAMVAAVRAEREVGVRSTVGELLEAWYAIASTGWAPTIIRQTRSVIDRYLHPHFGALAVGDITPARIDAVYATLRRSGGMRHQTLPAYVAVFASAVGTLHTQRRARVTLRRPGAVNSLRQSPLSHAGARWQDRSGVGVA